MRPGCAGWFPEVSLGPLGVVRAVAVAQLLQWLGEGPDRFQGRDRDLDIDDWLGGQSGHGRGSDVVEELVFSGW
jgi:hypothetical protein